MTTSECSILIVDDDYLIATELAQHLKLAGYDVVGPCSQVADARRLIADKRPDCAFLDINLGEGRTSFDFAEELETQGLPFAFITGYSSLPEGEKRFQDAGLLIKPVEPAAVAAQARRMCGSDNRPG